nr:MAG TPA: hypothetical protein [Caudovirales sp. ctNII2]
MLVKDKRYIKCLTKTKTGGKMSLESKRKRKCL